MNSGSRAEPLLFGCCSVLLLVSLPALMLVYAWLHSVRLARHSVKSLECKSAPALRVLLAVLQVIGAVASYAAAVEIAVSDGLLQTLRLRNREAMTVTIAASANSLSRCG